MTGWERGVTVVGDGFRERGDGDGARPHCIMCLGAKFALRAAPVDTMQAKDWNSRCSLCTDKHA